jgi:hypothetical protein
LSDFYPLVKKHLNHPRKLPLSDISPVWDSHSLFSAIDGVSALYTDWIWHCQYLNSENNEIFLTEVILLCPYNPTEIATQHNTQTLRKSNIIENTFLLAAGKTSCWRKGKKFM